MVGKSRGTLRGETRTTSGESLAEGMRLDTDAEDDAQSDIIEVALTAEPDTAGGTGSPVPGVQEDLTGRGTPGGRIAPQASGTAEERLAHPHNTPQETGIGAGTPGNLGAKHGRTEHGGDIPGGGGAPIPSEGGR